VTASEDLRTSSRALGPIALGCVAALAAGVLDVSLALLSKPRDFEALAAPMLPILATAAIFLAAFLALWAIVKPLASRTTFGTDAAAGALAGALLTFFTLAVLAGLHVSEMSAHTAFRAAVILAVSLGAGLGARRSAGYPTMLFAAPIILFEVLVFEWIEVYAIDSVVSLASALTVAALAAAASTTMLLFARIRPATARGALAAFVAVLALAPAVAAWYPARGSGVLADVSRPAGAPRRVVFVTIDTLRQDSVSAYGSTTRTPAIDTLAADGVVFENAWSTAPWTLPALASMLSGLAPQVHGVVGLTSRLSERVTTLPEALAVHGYRTAALVHNPLLEPARNFSQGIGEYVDLHAPSYGESVGARLLQKLGSAGVPAPDWPTNADQTSMAIDWLEANRNESFFLWVHYFDPHAPYAPPREYLPQQIPEGMGVRFEEQTALAKGILVPPPATRQWIRNLYDAEARDVDASLGRFIDGLKRLELYDDALIVLTSDHGEEFWEHGSQGHGQSLHPELLRVPFVVKLPGAAARRRVTPAVSTMSVMPTVLDLCRIAFKADDFSAPSLAPLMQDAEVTPVPIVSSVVWTAGGLVDERQSVGFDDFRYITAQIPGKEELFDQRADAGEDRSVAGSSPDRVETARRLLTEHMQKARALRTRLQIETSELGLDDETSRRLRTLGYVH
jgi:arylsulfatase A-like enzyme